MKLKNNCIEGAFLGLAIGDALGVPFEFRLRSVLTETPVEAMHGYGTWYQPAGTWSDDSSMTFCLAESLLNGYDLHRVGNSFMRWMKEGYWGAHHKVFDIGGTTRTALQRIYEGESPYYSGELEEESNGNGSLMRIVPASIYFFQSDDDTLFERMKEISGVTHRHFRSVFSCFIFSKLVSSILKGHRKPEAYQTTMKEVVRFADKHQFNKQEIGLFNRLLSGSLIDESTDKINSGGYVVDTLEASLWCWWNTDSYREAVLKAVNLGGDTDTTACVTGALAGLYYGSHEIPTAWKNSIARKEDIISLAANFQKCMDKLILAKS